MQRRTFIAAMVGSSFLVGCASPARQQLRSTRFAPNPNQVALNGWVKVGRDSTITVVMGKSDMGQGVHTALMMLVAEEMDANWAQMRWENAPIDPLYGNVAAMADGVPFRPDDQGSLARSVRWVMRSVMRQMGLMMTGGSSSVKDMWEPLREAAAITRATLVQAAAQHWGLKPEQVRVEAGVFKGPTQTLQLGEVVALLGNAPQPAANYRLKASSEFKLIGQPQRRDDVPAKSNGTALFGMDVRPPGLLFAALRLAPVRGAEVATVNDRAAKAMPGVQGVVTLPALHGGSGAVAVVANSTWAAMQAARALEVTFKDAAMSSVSTPQIMQTLSKALDEGGFAYWAKGDVAGVLQKSERVLKANYSAPYLAHATLEPMNCTVQYNATGQSATVWAPTQVPGLARRAAAKVLGLDEDKVQVELTYLGGGFGRRLEVDFVAQAAAVAKAFAGKPVQLVWSREDDTRHDFYRPACVSRFEAALDGTGQVAAWRNTSAGQAIVPGFLPRTTGLPGMGPDKTTAEGAFDQAYEFPHVRVGHVTVDLPVPVGFWRSVGHSHQAFFKESFLDECAHAAKQDPVAYRLALLQNHPRQRAVLERAAKESGWGQPLSAIDGAPVARGVALHESFGSVVAQVAEVSVQEGEIRVHRVTCVIDCGLAINPLTIAQQMEGSVAMGLSAALWGRIDIDKGQVQQSNFHDYSVLRMAHMPQVSTHVMPSSAPPEGVGEPGLPPIAPAVTNAVFVLTGQRLRELPLQLKS
jgi:isoquinoline 1-oxidoreductase beta subunit